jgi:peptidyl-prolyl cis-trans isomerase C
MRPGARLLALAFAISVLAPAHLASADGDDPVVARVGAIAVTRSDLERRLARVPAIQLATFGNGPAAIRRAFLEKVVVPELLLAQSARKGDVESRPDVRIRVLDAYRTSLIDAIKKESDQTIGPDDLTRYYAENREKFQTPERINLWRILVKTRDEAKQVLDDVKKPDGEKRWKEIARERSVDKATSERGGNLGFVGPDGQSNEVTVKVEAKLFEAAQKVKDGELVPIAIPEGEAWAVVWRRGSTPAVSRSIEQELGTIRTAVSRQRVETRSKELVERLRKEKVSDVSTDLLGMVDVTSTGDVGPRRRPGMGKPKAPGKPQPNPSSMR